MKIDELLGSARDAVTVKRVFGEPYEKEGVTVIPAASVMGSAVAAAARTRRGRRAAGAASTSRAGRSAPTSSRGPR